MTISTQRLRLLRGNSTAAGAFTGLQGELIFDTTLYTLRLQDGVTPGGYLLARASDVANVAANVYGNTNVAAYLTSYTGNLAAGNIFSNNYLYANGVNILSGIQSNYGNSNVAAYLTSYTGNLAAGNIFSNNYLYANGVSILTGIQSDYGNSNVAAYLVTYNGNLSAASIFSDNYLYANGVNILSGIQSNYGNSNVASYLTAYTGNLSAGNIVSGNILPLSNVAYSLGSATNQWKDLWLSNNTLYLDSTPITVANGSLSVGGNVIGGNTAQLSRDTYIVSLEIDGDVVFPGNLVSSEAAYANYLDLHVDGLGGIKLSGTGDFVLETDSDGSSNNWTFNANGNLTLPTNGSSILYANGVNILAGITGNSNEIVNGNSNVRIATANGNTTITTAGTNTWTFDTNGDLAVPNYIQFAGTSFIGDEPGALVPTFRITAPLGYQAAIETDADISGNNWLWTFGRDGVFSLPIGGNIVGVTANNNGYLAWYGNSSGDNNGYTTLGLVPDDTRVGTDQYLVVDPTAPGHIHIRAGGVQDNSNAELIIGGENTGFRVGAGSNPTAFIYANNHIWWLNPDGTLLIPNSDNGYAQLYTSGANLYLGSTSSPINIVGTDGSIVLPGNITGNTATFTTIFGTLGTAAQSGITSLGTLSGLAVSGSTSMTTLQVSGNATIGNLLVTGNSTIIGNITQISGNSGQFFGDASTGFNALYTGIAAGYTPLQQTIVQSSGNFNDYVQINLENVNSGNAATADYIVTADNGTDSTYFVDMGIASSNFDGLSPNIVGNSVRANDAYLYTIGNSAGNQGGNLIIGAGTSGKIIKLIAGGGHTNNIVATVAAGAFTVTGNITGTNIIGNGSQLTGVAAVTATTATTATYVTGLTSANVTTALGFVPANSNAASNYGNTNVAAYLPSYGGPINANVVTVSGNATVNGLTVNTSGVFTTTLHVRGGIQSTPIGNVSAASGQFTTISATGNITGANLIANGNVTGSFFIGNGALLSGITTTYSNTNVASYLTGNITVGNITGTQPNVILVANTFSYIFDNVGNITIPGNINYANGINILSGITGGTGNYSNANVAEYLPIYSGNINAAFYFGNGSQLTGITATTAVTSQFVTGLTSANVTTALGYTPTNYTDSNVSNLLANFGSNSISTSGNLTADYFIGNGALLTGIAASSNYGNSNVVTLLASFGSNTVSTTGNVTAGYFIGNGALLTGIVAGSTYSNTNVAAYLPIYGGLINANTIVGTANTTVNAFTVNTSATVGSTLGVTGNINAANVTVIGNVNATYFIGNGALLTGIVANTTYGNSNVAAYLTVYGGPINANVITGTANATVNGLAVNSTATIGSTLGVTGNINGFGITLTGSLRATGPGDFDGGLQSTPIGNVSPSSALFTTAGTSGNLTANALTVNNTATIGGTLGVTGNITTAANVTVTGNVVAQNLVTTGSNGNITGVNIVYGNLIGSGNTTVQAFTVNANATIGGTLGVTGATVLSGNLTINGALSGYAPNRPAMRVYGNASTNYTAGTTLTNQVVDYNQGSYYDNTTGIFTAPVAGLYHCYATVRVGNNNALNQAALVKNNSTSGSNVISFWETDTNTGTASHFAMTGYAKCVVGDTIRFKVVTGNIQFDANDSWGITYIG